MGTIPVKKVSHGAGINKVDLEKANICVGVCRQLTIRDSCSTTSFIKDVHVPDGINIIWGSHQIKFISRSLYGIPYA